MDDNNTQMEMAEIENKFDEFDIDMEMIVQEWNTSVAHTEGYTRDFPQLDQIVDAIPLHHEKGSPYMGDTTITGLVHSMPRESIQQLPIFAAVINGSKLTVSAAVCSYFLRKGVFNENTFGRGLISTAQIGTEQGISHGYAPFIAKVGSMADDFGTTLGLLHYSDVAPEAGIQDKNESGYDYVKANLTKSRVKRIRDAAMDNPNTSWDVEALNELLEMKPEAQNYSIYMSDAQKNPNATSPTYTFVTRYEVGKGGVFITFCPQLQNRPLRVIKNQSKFGYPRVLFLVIDPAPLHPYGISRVRLASPVQNFNNAYYQSVGSMLLFNSKPLVVQRGKFSTPVQMKRGHVAKTLDPQANVEVKEMSNSTLQQFPQVMQETQKQIQNVMGKPTRNTDLGNTSPGAKQQIKYEDTSTNQITNIIENFLRQYGLVGLDTLISEQIIENNVDPETGEKIPNEEELILDDEAKNTINRIFEDQFTPEVDPTDPTGQTMTQFVPPIGDDNKFTIDWNDFYDDIKTMSVEIELSIGKDELEEKKRGDLQDTLTVIEQNADPNDPAKQKKINELEDRLLQDTVPESSRMSSGNPRPVGNPNYQPPAGPTTTEISPQVSVTQ